MWSHIMVVLWIACILPSTTGRRTFSLSNHGLLNAVALSGGANQEDGENTGRRPRRQEKSSISSLVKNSMSFTGKAVSATAKQSGKAAYWAVRPKSVALKELVGLWRMDQQIILHAEDGPLEAISNMELTPKHICVVLEGEREKTPLKFVSAKFPKSARVEFVAKAFQLEGDKPALFFYKGYIHRKLADTSVLKIKGKIYRITRTGFRGKTIKYVPVGTFVARKRMRFSDDLEERDWESEAEYSEDEGEIE